MEKEFNELRNYYNEAKRRTRNDRYNAFVLAGYSENAVKQIDLIKLKLSDAKEIETCEKINKELIQVADLLKQYSDTIEYPVMDGDTRLFIKINHTLYNNLEELLEFFDKLEEY
jgi:hypothetical protein